MIKKTVLPKPLFFFLICACVFAIPVVSETDVSQNKSAFLKGSEELRFCKKQSYMPLMGMNGEGEKIGLLTGFSKLIAKKLNKHILFVSEDSQLETIQQLKAGECDVFLSQIQQTIHNKSLANSIPFFHEPVVIAISNEKEAIYEYKYLLDKSFAITKDTALFNILKDKYPELHFIPVYNAKIGLAMVTAGNVYGYVDSLTSLAYQAKIYGVLGLKSIEFLNNTVQHAFVTGKGRATLLNNLNKAVSSITEGERNNIVSTWAGINFQKKMVNYALSIWIVFLLLVFILICLYLLFRFNNQIKKLQSSFKSLLLEKQQLDIDLCQKLDSEKQSIRFAEMFSHEYRTPVSIISTNLDVLEIKNEQNSFFIDSQLEKMRDAVSKLIVLVETALDRESLASTHLVAEKTELNFLPLIHEVKNEMQINHPKRTLEIQATESSYLLHGDKKLLKIMLKNLIENAFKYSHINQIVSIDLYTENKTIFVMITDLGIGIPFADIKHIFDKYHRAANTSNISGIGLGLYLSKLIANQHKGNITVTCPPEGGTQIKIDLPQ